MKIAIVQLGRIGDLVLVTSAINLIKSKYPDAEIDFIVGQNNAEIVKNNPNISRVLIFYKNPIKLIPFIFRLKNRLYDYYVDVKDHHSTESNILARLANAIIKVGFNYKDGKLFDISIPSDKENINLHFVKRIEKIFELIDISPLDKPNRPNLFIPQISKECIENYLKTNKIINYILINISASVANRMWGEENWIEFINFIKVQYKELIIIISDARHSEQAKNIANQTKILHHPPTNLFNIFSLIINSKLLISPDTSLIHIASAFDTPAISLTNNIPFNIVKFAPLSTINEIVFPNSNEKIYVPDISVEQVKEAFIKVIEKI